MSDSADRSPDEPLRVAAVSYLNAQPLIGDLRQEARLQVRDCPPAVAASDLLAGQVDLALVPAVVLARDPDLTLLPDLGIAARGPVDSVFLYLRDDLLEGTLHRDQPLQIALDPRSRSSQMLVRIYLETFRELPANRIAYREVEPEVSLAPGSAADGVLVIGDAALGRSAPSGFRRLDLAAMWQRETGLPFVFAVWALKQSLLDRNVWLPERFQLALERGEQSLESIVDGFSEPLRVGRSEALDYLRHRIVYRLAGPERAGLRLFLNYARSRL